MILLIGASLIGESGFLSTSARPVRGSGLVLTLTSAGVADWAGGSNDCHTRPETGFFALCPNVIAPKAALWGSPQFLGLGFFSFMTIILVEIFGSPFMRNSSIVRAACQLFSMSLPVRLTVISVRFVRSSASRSA